MTTLLTLYVCGAIGGLVFTYFSLPGGAMTGSMLAVIIFKTFEVMPDVEVPPLLQWCVYVALGVYIGNMYKPGMLAALRMTWPVLIGSTALLLIAGFISTLLVYKYGGLSVSSAYLAASPGGLNVLAGLAADMGPDAPFVVAYHLVRLYTIMLTAPYIVKAIAVFTK